MNTRQLIFKNFRNLGITDSVCENLSNTLLIDSIDPKHVGGIIVLLGGNNDGKSNVLDGFMRFGKKNIENRDSPDFMGYEKENPKLTLDYKITDKEMIEKIENILANKKDSQDMKSGILAGKTFGIFFTEGSLEKGVEFSQTDTKEEYCAFIEKMLINSEVYGIYGHDEFSDRLEIRLILTQHNRMLLCSAEQGGKALKCFSVIEKGYNEIKDIERAIKLNCKFKVNIKAPKNCDDASLLRQFLKESFESKSNANTNLSNKTNQIKQETNQPLHLKVILELIDNKISYKTIITKKQFDTEFIDSKNKEKIQNKSIQILEQDIESIQQCLNTPLHPNIVLYTEQALKDGDLESSGDELKNSKFFATLFKILEIDAETLQNELKSRTSNRRKSRERELDKKCEHINNRFNSLYCLSNDIYSFSLRLEADKIEFCMNKNGEDIYLSKQSTGFKKFFNLFFNFLYDDKIGKGDIVLIDEIETHLGIPAQKELRIFLKDYGQKSGIKFIVSTHSPYMVDVKHLDEIRIVKALNSLEFANNNTKGSLFINDFSMLGYGEIDVLNDLRNALGANIDFDSNKIMFVEGIMDYNILNAYSEIYAEDNENNGDKNLRIIFLPISGLGGYKIEQETNNNDKNNLDFSDEQKEKAKNLIRFAKQIKISNPILLVDSDKSGKAMKKGVKENPNIKNLSIITLEEAFLDGKGERKKQFKNVEFTNIELLLSKEDRAKFGLETCKENKQSSIISSVFKNTNRLKEKLSQESKNNFNELFAYLVDFINKNKYGLHVV